MIEHKRLKTYKAVDVIAAQKDLLKNFVTPAGFKSKVMKTESFMHGDPDLDMIEFSNGNIVIKLTFPHIKKSEKPDWSFSIALGDTEYLYEGKKYSFTRHGIDISSFDIYYNAVDDFKKALTVSQYTKYIVDGQIVRALAALERSKTLITVPGTNFRITVENKTEYTKLLLKNKSVTLTPAGFGTGYRLNVLKNDSWSKPNAELAKFFEVPSIFVSHMDCD